MSRLIRTLSVCSAICAAVVCATFKDAIAIQPKVAGADTEVVTSTDAPSSNDSINIAIYAREQDGLEFWLNNPERSRIGSGFDLSNPGGALGSERFLAMETLRENTIGFLNAGASRRSARANVRIARLIREHRGVVTGHLPAPHVVYARIPGNAFRSIAHSPLVQSVSLMGNRTYAGVAELSGADVWHTAGCSGAGALDTTCPATTAPQSSTGPTDIPDNQGGPDLAVDDMGINNHHDAFTGGPTPSLGRTPPIVKPEGAPATNGSLHANTIAAVVAVKDPAHRGTAFGIDKILDPAAPGVAQNLWMLGIAFEGTPGSPDLPETINKSYGFLSTSYHAADDDVYSREADMEVTQYGFASSVSAGNSGPYPPLGGPLRPYSDPGQSGHQARVAHPCVAFNVICVGSVHNTVDTDRANDVVEDFSSRGPSAGGRKKPDLVAHVGSGWGCPDGGGAVVDDSLWRGGSICGEGTSYSAPFAAGGQLLLAGVGVTSPMAQKAVLVNSAFEIDSEQDLDTAPQEYWTPDVGWGEIALEQAFADRGNFRLSTVGPAPVNNVRFFRLNGQSIGDRTTLTWNRRAIVTDYNELETVAYTTSDLDIQQITLAGADNDKDVCGASTTCGIDLSEDTDSGPTVVTGGVVTKWNASDSANDTVEQVRAKTVGDSIVKVKASSTVDGAPSEDFALASTQPIAPLGTPTIHAPAPTLSIPQSELNENVTVTANVTNESSGADLVEGMDLDEGDVSINLPPGVQLLSGTQTQSLNGLDAGQSKEFQWTVAATTSGPHEITFTAQGNRFGETFESTSAQATLTADGEPPEVAVNAPSGWQSQKSNQVSWSATDSHTSVSNVTVEADVNSSGFQSVYSGPTVDGIALISAAEGQTVAVRVRAIDLLGNTSAYAHATWKIDAEAPELEVVAPQTVLYGDTANVQVTPRNVGSVIATSYRIDDSVFAPLLGRQIVIPNVKRATKLEVRLIDELGRVVFKTVSINPRPHQTRLSVSTQRDRRGTKLRVAVSPKVHGKLTVTLSCAKKRRVFRSSVRSGSSSVRLGSGLGRCTARIEFRPMSLKSHAPSTRRLKVRV